MTKRWRKIAPEERAIFLAYDHGLEHGPKPLVGTSIDPEHILDIALKADLDAIALLPGIAEKYWLTLKQRIPLILKLNGKTDLRKNDDEYYPSLLSSVEEAVNYFGARAVGYTIHPGSKYEGLMFKEFRKIVQEARSYDVPVIAWVYPRGRDIQSEHDPKVVCYAARIALELGADIAKIRWPGSSKAFHQAVKAAGKTKIVLSGGIMTKTENEFFALSRQVINAGAIGLAVGKNIWQRENALEMAIKLKQIIHNA
ncbi:aldolase [Patescibacteria group bacterium AH-259-L07]|nr:aldolase [Patescibacteria group bacterium AH-259-L07]